MTQPTPTLETAGTDSAAGDAGSEHDDFDGYRGPAVLELPDQELEVQVKLTGAFQPIDGRFHWQGRVAADEALVGAVRSGGTVTIRIGDHRAEAKLNDVDPWGRFRIAGLGRPPYDLDEPDSD